MLKQQRDIKETKEAENHACRVLCTKCGHEGVDNEEFLMHGFHCFGTRLGHFVLICVQGKRKSHLVEEKGSHELMVTSFPNNKKLTGAQLGHFILHNFYCMKRTDSEGEGRGRICCSSGGTEK